MDYNFTDEEWLSYLEMQLLLQRPAVQKYKDYYNGKHPLAFATSKFREAFGDTFGEFADNFMELVVDVPVDKLRIDGFEFGSVEMNARAWALWQRDDMGKKARQAHTDAAKTGTAYILVDEFSKRVTVEDPSECYVEVEPGTGDRLAGIKRWVGVDSKVYANLYLPDRTVKFVSKTEVSKGPVSRVEREALSFGYVPRDGRATLPNTLGVVPLIPLENNPSTDEGGRSDLEVVIPLQNGTNKELMDMFVASEFQAFRQRVLTGVEVPKYPEGHALEGQPIPSADLMASISRVWFLEDKDAKVTELGGVDLNNYVQVVEMLVQHIATKSRIPPQHFLASNSTLANVNEQSMAIISDGFISKCERKQEDGNPTWREVVRLRLKLDGAPLPDDPAAGLPKWRPIVEPSIPGLADALVKLKDLGVPLEWLWQKLGATPEEAADWRKDMDKRNAKAAQLAAAQPPRVVLPPGAQASTQPALAGDEAPAA